MCMKVFALHRCRTPANGGCDGYFAEYLQDQGCNRMMHGGLPQLDCRTVWAGFEDERSAKVNHRDSYAKRARLCPACQHARQMAEPPTSRPLVADLTRRAELGRTEFLLRVYHELWDAARCLVAGLSARTDAAWDAIEAALRAHFEGGGGGGMATTPARALVAALWEAKRGLTGHVRTSVKELAVALVGPNECWDDDLELGGYIDEDWRRQRQAAVEASRKTAQDAEEREEEQHGLRRR
ncbi:uncharacterized protein GLRG_05669 [Colletotrichum graminicola M1.001]|uniref:Uncharacterized protein n=1 Tax=Colletotrichum graminicola (strain M1.001 / M2 / FGSC 10212) TaxID=645133 RepID=E3QI37_COLGM|nr:uncharacterized protein GLRG_05669 [Colletotrichum graminicola M1.001]EFQ30525.1 hypothetical protein GLRG_05669 [Colletotrichum graminicola M1.001]